eukprot:704262-Alexandrium_andersonii.AAC.1
MTQLLGRATEDPGPVGDPDIGLALVLADHDARPPPELGLRALGLPPEVDPLADLERTSFCAAA